MSDDLVKRLRLEVAHANDTADVAIERAKELEAKLADAKKGAMADALIVIQNGTSDPWVKNLRPPHIFRMVGLLSGGNRT